MIIAFDVDNTLLLEHNGGVVINHDMVALMRAVFNLGLADIVVWSGGGADYAKQIVHRYGLDDMVSLACMKGTIAVHIAIDDQDIDLARVNLKLPGDIEATPYMGFW